jgi:hypothetical protein
MEFLKDKKFIAMALGVVVLGLFLGRKKTQDAQGIQLTKYDTEARNSTVFVPTSETNIEYIAGNQTISNSDSRSTVAIGDGSSVNLPVTKPAPAPIDKTVNSNKKYKQIYNVSSIFETQSSQYSIGEIAPQRVEVIQENPSGMLLIKSWKGNVWMKDGYVRPKAPTTKNHTIQKGDTLFALAGGNNAKVQQIAKLNGIANVNKIVAGTNIKLPV